MNSPSRSQSQKNPIGGLILKNLWFSVSSSSQPWEVSRSSSNPMIRKGSLNASKSSKLTKKYSNRCSNKLLKCCSVRIMKGRNRKIENMSNNGSKSKFWCNRCKASRFSSMTWRCYLHRRNRSCLIDRRLYPKNRKLLYRRIRKSFSWNWSKRAWLKLRRSQRKKR